MGIHENISSSATVKRTEGIVGCDIDSEIIIMSIDNGEYYNFNEVASSIWRSIENQSQIREVVDKLISEFHIEPQECEESVISFLEKLQGEGLVILE